MPNAADAVHEAVHRDGDPLDGGVLGVPPPEKTIRGKAAKFF
jgi:hypothetical protein